MTSHTHHEGVGDLSLTLKDFLGRVERSPKHMQPGLREQRKETDMVLLWWVRSVARVWFTLCGLNFQLMLKKGASDLGFLISFSRCGAAVEEGGMRLKSAQQSNIKKN